MPHDPELTGAGGGESPLAPMTTSASQVEAGNRRITLITAFLCGAVVMEVEVLGTRIISPWFGVSLFVWTALITVTLLSLAAGYYAGGRLADAKEGSMAWLGLVVAFAGACLLLIPLIRIPVLQGALWAGVRGGALLASLLLFAPVLTALGMVMPFVARLFLHDVRETGHTIGNLTALSTLGSFVGTVLTGFWLIPSFHVDQIAAGSAAVLLGLGGVLLARSLQRTVFMVLVAPTLFFLKAPPLVEAQGPIGTRIELVYQSSSYYGQIKVVDITKNLHQTRELLLDGFVQGGIDVDTGRSAFRYIYALERVGMTFNPTAKRALVIGLGPGSVPEQLSRAGLSGTIVEIDPKIVEVAREYFAFKTPSFPVTIADGRTYLEKTQEHFDFILLDAFAGESEPTHLLTAEAFRAMRKVLSPGGVLVLNSSGFAPGAGVKNSALDSILQTMKTAFPEVAAYPYPPNAKAGAVIGFILMGRDAGIGFTAEAESDIPHKAVDVEMPQGFMASSYAPQEGSVLTDDWAPLEKLNAPIKLLLRKRHLNETPAEILLN